MLRKGRSSRKQRRAPEPDDVRPPAPPDVRPIPYEAPAAAPFEDDAPDEAVQREEREPETKPVPEHDPGLEFDGWPEPDDWPDLPADVDSRDTESGAPDDPDQDSEADRQHDSAPAVDATMEGRLAELEGVLTGVEASRARVEAERDELEEHMTVEIGQLRQAHDEQLAAAQQRIESLADLLEKQTREADDERVQRDSQRAQDAEQISELQRRLVEEQSQAERRARDLQSEIQAKPHTERQIVDLQGALDRETALRFELEPQVASLMEAQRALGQELTEQKTATQARIAELGLTLVQARAERDQAAAEVDDLGERLEAMETVQLEHGRERDLAAARIEDLERELKHATGRAEHLEAELASVSEDRDHIESDRRILETRMTVRDSAERALIAERDAERRTARAQNLELTRAERRMTEITRNLEGLIARLAVPTDDPAEHSEKAPPAKPALDLPPAGSTAEAPPPPSQDVPPSDNVSEPAEDASVQAGDDRAVISGFLASAERFPSRPAVSVAGKTLDYAHVRNQAQRIATTLLRHHPGGEAPLTAVLAQDSPTEFEGLLAVLMAGHGCVPLDGRLAIKDARTVLAQAGCRAIVADETWVQQLPELLDGAEPGMLVLVPEHEGSDDLLDALPDCRVLAGGQLETAGSWRPVAIDPSAIAYVQFTYDADGTPLSLPVSHLDLLDRADEIRRYGPDEIDRALVTDGESFDIPVVELFVAWERGQCVSVPGS